MPRTGIEPARYLIVQTEGKREVCRLLTCPTINLIVSASKIHSVWIGMRRGSGLESRGRITSRTP